MSTLAGVVAAQVLIELPTLPPRPAWVETEHRAESGGDVALFWQRHVNTEAGELVVEQYVYRLADGVPATVSPAYWRGTCAALELTAEACLALGAALQHVAQIVEQINRDTLTLVEAGQ